jgi:hypothetical protein
MPDAQAEETLYLFTRVREASPRRLWCVVVQRLLDAAAEAEPQLAAGP